MKKKIILFLSFLLTVMSLTGCALTLEKMAEISATFILITIILGILVLILIFVMIFNFIVFLIKKLVKWIFGKK